MNIRDIDTTTTAPDVAPARVEAPVVISDAGVQPIIAATQTTVTALAVQHKAVKIEDNDMAVAFGDTLTALKRERKRLDDQRLSLTKGLRDTVDKINKLAAGPIGDLDKLISAFEYQIVDWTKRERARMELERKAAERRAEEERERLAAEAESARADAERIKREADASGDAEAIAEAEATAQSLNDYAENTVALAERVEAAPVYDQPRSRGTSVATTWSAEVVDFGALPDQYKIADMAALNALARARHERMNIPGVKAVSQMGVRSRL